MPDLNLAQILLTAVWNADQALNFYTVIKQIHTC